MRGGESPRRRVPRRVVVVVVGGGGPRRERGSLSPPPPLSARARGEGGAGLSRARSRRGARSGGTRKFGRPRWCRAELESGPGGVGARRGRGPAVAVWGRAELCAADEHLMFAERVRGRGLRSVRVPLSFLVCVCVCVRAVGFFFGVCVLFCFPPSRFRDVCRISALVMGGIGEIPPPPPPPDGRKPRTRRAVHGVTECGTGPNGTASQH